MLIIFLSLIYHSHLTSWICWISIWAAICINETMQVTSIKTYSKQIMVIKGFNIQNSSCKCTNLSYRDMLQCVHFFTAKSTKCEELVKSKHKFVYAELNIEFTYIQTSNLWHIKTWCCKYLQGWQAFRFLLSSSLIFAAFILVSFLLLGFCTNNTKHISVISPFLPCTCSIFTNCS